MTDTATAPPTVRLAVDVGGTFTDVVALDPESGTIRFDKVPTTPDEPSRCVLDSFERAEVAIERIAYFVHGTTLGLNALLTRRGARTAIVTTKGFRDVYQLGRTSRQPMYDFFYHRPTSLVPRRDTFEVTERLNYLGEVLEPLDLDEAREVCERLAQLGVEAVAICLLHAYANPDHEQQVRRLLEAGSPGIEVSVSHELSREYREYERTSTTVLDAYIKPIVRRYLARLEGALGENGFRGHFLMTRSGSGAMTAARAREAPAHLILSGPAGGVMGAAWFARATAHRNLITMDMGGTSLDASLVIDGEPVPQHEASFEGLPITIPSLYIHTIGAGGGSIVWIDEGGHLQVGPQSAGAVPGPASYGLGGEQAAFTDAALVVGYLGSENALAGTLRLDEGLARAALEPSAKALGMGIDEVAYGVVRIAVTKVVGAIRAITVELGHNPGDFALLAFGGGGGLVAVDVARELSIPTVIMPPGPGAFSALGMLVADVRHDFSRTRISLLAEADLALLEEHFAEMRAEGEAALEAEGFEPGRRRFSRTVDVRYVGQEHSVSLPLGERLDTGEVARLAQAFAVAHERQYGHAMAEPAEIVTIRLQAIGTVDPPRLPELEPGDASPPAPVGERLVQRPDGTRLAYRLYDRAAFRAGDSLSGPAVIGEHTATTVLHGGDRAGVGRYGEIVIEVAKEEQRG
ncbi:MAG TPA: hydantoinase/oxoprolinase family protein [Acidimicrobiales bacterium]|nr:hydantoinase/oxoprolinase family protein [Acidimicrobiales bacterium]